MRIFLSHSSRDKALVRDIRRRLPPYINTWLDEDKLLFGMNIATSIKTAIEADSDFVVLFLSQDAVNSAWVKRELSWALKREEKLGYTFVLPVLIEDVWDLVQPDKFRERLYLRCIDQSDQSLAAFADHLTTQLFGWVTNHFDEQRSQQAKLEKEQAAWKNNTKSALEMTRGWDEIMSKWLEDFRNLCIRIALLDADIQLERIDSFLSRELPKWQDALRSSERYRDEDNEDSGSAFEQNKRFALAALVPLYNRMVGILSSCSDDIAMWRKHSDRVEAKFILESIYRTLGISTLSP